MLVGSESEVQEISIAATHFGHPDSIDIAFFDIKGQMTEEMIKRYSEAHCEPKATDGFKMEPGLICCSRIPTFSP